MSVNIVEVGPRDGLQNEFHILPTEFKLEFIKQLISAGLSSIEVTSFVKADKIPQMQDSLELMKLINNEKLISNDRKLIALVPNDKGLENAIAGQLKHIAVFTATSDGFNKKNINATIDESLQKIIPVIKKAKVNNIEVRGYISTVFGCPYEGKTSVDKLKEVAQILRDAGVYELSLGDTIGIAQPEQVKNVISEMKKDFDLSQIAMHFHDTRGLALSNIYSSWQEGIKTFDSSAGGLGGCPYAVGASGNVATEDVVNLFESMGIATGIDLEKVVLASKNVLNRLGKTSPSKYFQYAQSR